MKILLLHDTVFLYESNWMLTASHKSLNNICHKFQIFKTNNWKKEEFLDESRLICELKFRVWLQSLFLRFISSLHEWSTHFLRDQLLK